MSQMLLQAHRSLRALRLVEMTGVGVCLVETTVVDVRICHFDRGLPSGEIYAPNSTLSCHSERSEESSLSANKLHWSVPLQDPFANAQDDKMIVSGS